MSYQRLFADGSLISIRDLLLEKMRSCSLCPRLCSVDRLKDKRGFCQSGRQAKVSSFFLHFQEEAELTGDKGSGTIFFSHCNLHCCYCQNHLLSHDGQGTIFDAAGLCDMILALQAQGALNINFVTPTHVIANIIESLILAIPKGLSIPLVYNCSGYESVATLKLLNGIFDIYMPDIKYADNTAGKRYSGVDDYWDVAQQALIEMQRQVGCLELSSGIAKKGLLVRHLVLPYDTAGTAAVLNFLKEKVSPDVFVNVMDQYQPCYKAGEYGELSRPVTAEEYRRACACRDLLGLRHSNA